MCILRWCSLETLLAQPRMINYAKKNKLKSSKKQQNNQLFTASHKMLGRASCFVASTTHLEGEKIKLVSDIGANPSGRKCWIPVLTLLKIVANKRSKGWISDLSSITKHIIVVRKYWQSEFEDLNWLKSKSKIANRAQKTTLTKLKASNRKSGVHAQKLANQTGGELLTRRVAPPLPTSVVLSGSLIGKQEPLSLRSPFAVFTYSNKLSKPENTQFVIHQSFALLKILGTSSAYKSVSLAPPPLLLVQLSDDKVNTRVISLVTALSCSILEGYTPTTHLMLPLRLNRQNQSLSNAALPPPIAPPIQPTLVWPALNKQPVLNFASDYR